MKKWLAILVIPVLCATSALAGWESVDTWDMDSNGQWQNSDMGLNLGGHYNSNLQQFVQTPDDGLFVFGPTNTSSFGGKPSLSAATDITSGVVRLTWKYDSMNWTNTPTANNQVGFRLWNDAGTEYVGLAFQDNSDKIWAYLKSSSGLGSLSVKTGRVINSLIDSSTPRTVIMEIDYANGEVRMSAEPAWQWSGVAGQPGTYVHTNAVDFAGAGITDLSKFQTYYQNWSTGEQTVFDNLAYEKFVPEVIPEGVYIANGDGVGVNGGNTAQTNTFANLSVTNGDYVVVGASVNKGTWNSTNVISFAGSASLGAVTYTNANGAGPETHFWYAPVSSTGTVDVTLTLTDADNTKAFAPVNAYVLRSSTGGINVLGAASDGSTTNETSLLGTVYTNTYDFGTSSTGLLLEAASSYMNDGGGFNSDNAGYVVDQNDGAQRKVGHVDFSGVSTITNIWSGTTNRQAVVLGIAFTAGSPISPTTLWDDWIESFPGVGANDGWLDHGDSDQLDNLSEYAFGGDPSDGNDQGNTPVQSQVDDGGTNYLQYVHYERDDAGDRGLLYILEVGTDLVITNWTTSGIEPMGSGASGISGYNAVTNRISTDTEIKRFLNLRVKFTP